MSIKISTPNVKSANPDCPDCYGNGYRWDNLVCNCVQNVVNEVVIVDDRERLPERPQSFLESAKPWKGEHNGTNR